MEPRIAERGPMRVVGMGGRFTPETASGIGALWGRFMPRLAEIPGRREPGVTYGVCAPGPKPDGGPGAFEYTACAAVEATAKAPPGMVALDLPAATCAVFTHSGPIAGIGRTWEAIHTRWLSDAGLAPTGSPGLESYDQRWDASTGEGPVDIWVPVRPRA